MSGDEEKPEPAVSGRARLALLSSLGFALPVSIAAGGFLGYWADGKLSTFPWLTLVGFLLGVAAGFVNLIRAVKIYDKSD